MSKFCRQCPEKDENKCDIHDCLRQLDCIVCGKKLIDHDTVDYVLLKHIIWQCQPQTYFCCAVAGDCINVLPAWYKQLENEDILSIEKEVIP